MKEKIKNYLIYILNLALFLFILFYSIKYWNFIKTNLSLIKLFPLLISFIFLFIILLLASYRWKFLLDIFNKKTSFKNIFLIYNASGIYKYVPPKGINYIIRFEFFKKLKLELEGKIISILGEGFLDVYIALLYAIILILTIFKINMLSSIILFSIVILATLAILKFEMFIKLLELFRIKSNKIMLFFRNFKTLTKSKLFYYAILTTILMTILHGLAFYFSSKALSINISILSSIIIFSSSQFLAFIMFSPAGLGVRDASIITLLKLQGLTIEQSILLALLYRVLIFISELIFGIFSLYKIHIKPKSTL